ncbi:hypothetical protein J7E55_25925 [Bacillus sp. ISL-53]|nr:hypothetical protein [Bacillus sp. ISL-53]
MAKYTVVKLNYGRSMEEILEAINEQKFNLTPQDFDWPATQELFAKWVPFTARMGINRAEKTLEFPSEYTIDTGGKLETIKIAEEDFTLEYDERFIISGVEIVRPKSDWYDFDGQLLPLDKRTNSFQTEAIFFNKDDITYVAILGSPKSNKVSRTKKDLLEPCGLITHTPGIRLDELGLPAEFNLQSDFFYWLYYLYKEGQGIIPCKPVPIFIIELSGFHGTALEETQRTKSLGDRISELLTTNAFIFADDDIKALRLCLQYGQEIVELELHHDGSLDLLSYDGTLGDVIPHFKNQNVIVYIYNVLLPLLISAYESSVSVESGAWNRSMRDQFLNKIGVEMIAHITEELKKLTPNRTIGNNDENQSAS